MAGRGGERASESWWLPVAAAHAHRAVEAVHDGFTTAAALRRQATGRPVYGRWRVPDRDGVPTDVVLRSPRLSDGPGWRATRLAERGRLRAQFADRPGPGGGAGDVNGWAGAHTQLAWTERCVRSNRALARGLAVPGVLVSADERRVLGEFGVDFVDRRTATGELAFWRSAALAGGAVTAWAVATVVDRAFRTAQPLDRVVAPVAVPNRAAAQCLRRVGFTAETRLPRFRRYDGRACDHDIYVLHNSAGLRATLHAMILDEPSARRLTS